MFDKKNKIFRLFRILPWKLWCWRTYLMQKFQWEHVVCKLLDNNRCVWQFKLWLFLLLTLKATANIKFFPNKWACGAYGWGEGVYRVLVGKSEGKRPLGRPRRRWVDNIRMYLQDVGCGYMDWLGLAQDRDRWRTLVSVVMNFRVPWNAGNFLTSCTPVSFSRRTLHHGVSNK